MQSISRDFRTTGDRLQNRGWEDGGNPGKYRLSGEGLNRTKLGLKRNWKMWEYAPPPRLNRTKLGLKRLVIIDDPQTDECLNRTKLGLKLSWLQEELNLSDSES